VTLTLGLLLSIVALAEPEDAEEEEHPSEAMDALLEAARRKAFWRRATANWFGRRWIWRQVVREVMTPRPEIFAVPETLTLKDLLEVLKENSFSRVPVFVGSLDHVTGIVFARDLLQVLDADAARRTVAELQRPTEFVPETKKVAELLSDMPAGEAAHADSDRRVRRRGRTGDDRGPAGGDRGSIADEHDQAEEVNEPVRERTGDSWCREASKCRGCASCCGPVGSRDTRAAGSRRGRRIRGRAGRERSAAADAAPAAGL